ncbi:MAG: adenylate cyclase, partial [Anaerotignum sp.]
MEIERKFLTKHIPFDVTIYPCQQISQAYISFSPTIRIRQSNEDYILTVKGKGHLAREEFELPLRKEDYDR